MPASRHRTGGAGVDGVSSANLARMAASVLVAMLLLGSIPPHAARAADAPRHGPPADDATIDAYLRQAAADLGIPGLAFGIVRGDAAPHTFTVGTADDSGRPITADTPFLLPSVARASPPPA